MTQASTDPDDLLGRAVSDIDAPGVAVAIFGRNGLLWHAVRGVCDAEKPEPVGLSTRFALDAVTHTFTGMAMMMLRDAGALSLDDPLVRTVPEAAALRYPTTDSPPITLRHLLTHTSGLPRGARELRKDIGHEVGEADFLAHVASLDLDFAPGTAGSSSNLGFALLGIVIQRVSGEPYGALITRRILGPLGLASMSFQPGEPLAAPHRKPEGGGFRPRSRPRQPEACYQAAIGLHGSVLDLARYGCVHLGAWPPRDGPDAEIPLRRATLREAHRPGGFHRVGRNSQGLGWLIERNPVVGDVVWRHGSSFGYSSFIGFEPDVGIGAAALANIDIDIEKPLFDLLGKYKVAHGLIEDWRR